jgi:anion-transporting  ArsA/GET3 family ATPase
MKPSSRRRDWKTVDRLQFFSASRLMIVAGKGGVGKTAVTAVLARAAARIGLRVLVIELDGKAGLAGLLGGEAEAVLTYEEQEFLDGGSVSARTLTAGRALVEYLDDHGLRRVSKRLTSAGVIDVVSTAAPGIEDLLVLGKIKQLERLGEHDLVVVDGPASGHAVTFLMSARGLADAARVGPIQTQAHDVLELLADHERCQVVLVTVPEFTPVNELIETAFALEDRVGVALGPVIVNAVDEDADGLDGPEPLPPVPSRLAGASADDLAALVAAADFRNARRELHTEQLERLAKELPLQQVRLPLVMTAGLDAADTEHLAEVLLGQVDELA